MLKYEVMAVNGARRLKEGIRWAATNKRASVYTGALLATVTPVSRYRSLCFLKAVIGTLNYAGRSGDFGAYFYDFFLQRPHIIQIGVCFPAQFLQTLDFP